MTAFDSRQCRYMWRIMRPSPVTGVTIGAAGTPNANANCTAVEMTGYQNIAFFATMPHDGEPSVVGVASSSDCGTR
jgi:hypothetical protein